MDRQELERILLRRFTGAAKDQIAAATNAIMSLGTDCEEADSREPENLDHHIGMLGYAMVAGGLTVRMDDR